MGGALVCWSKLSKEMGGNLAIFCDGDLFGGDGENVTPFQNGLSHLQLGDEKVTLNRLVCVC